MLLSLTRAVKRMQNYTSLIIWKEIEVLNAVELMDAGAFVDKLVSIFRWWRELSDRNRWAWMPSDHWRPEVNIRRAKQDVSRHLEIQYGGLGLLKRCGMHSYILQCCCFPNRSWRCLVSGNQCPIFKSKMATFGFGKLATIEENVPCSDFKQISGNVLRHIWNWDDV